MPIAQKVTDRLFRAQPDVVNERIASVVAPAA
jgi:hypothetical protein